MSSKLITTVLAVIIVGPFTYMASVDALSIKQHLAQQNQHIQSLNTEYKNLNTELAKTQETKIQTQAEVQQLDQQTQDAASERAKLEAELVAN